MSTHADLITHTVYSDPREHAGLLDAVPTDLAALSAVARNIIIHYRASGLDLPHSTQGDIDLRWLSAILGTDQARHGRPLTEPRAGTSRVQGCCRDHSLFCVGVLRQHGIPARTRVGFAGYFVPGYFHDHVIVEAWQATVAGGRWRRFDPEIEEPRPGLAAPTDIPAGPRSPFLSAAEVWCGYRAGDLDPNTFGVEPGSDIGGAWFIQNYVLGELAHRHGDELLLWDSWGRMARPGPDVDPATAELTDEVVALLIAADQGDASAERALAAWYVADDRLHPGPTVIRHSPLGLGPVPEQVGRAYPGVRPCAR